MSNTRRALATPGWSVFLWIMMSNCFLGRCTTSAPSRRRGTKRLYPVLFPAFAAALAGCSPSDTSAPQEWIRGAAETPEDAAAMSETYKIRLEPTSVKGVEPKALDVPPDVTTQGRFGPVFTWPVIPLHATLLPDGRVLGFGSGPDGQQGTQKYAVWNPALGVDAAAITTLSNTTGTNIFCSGGGLIPATGDVLIVGGDRRVNWQTNYGNADFNVFRTGTGALERQAQPMAYRRWYPSVVTLRDGSQLIMGGRDDKEFAGTATYPPTTATFATTPELYVSGQGFRSLDGANSAEVFGRDNAQWNYPRAFLGPWGRVFIAGFGGKTWWLDASGDGSLAPVGLRWPDGLPPSAPSLPTVMYAPGKLLALGYGARATKIDLMQYAPFPSTAEPLSQMRFWASAAVQADGQVFVNGGSTVYNEMTGVSYRSETWNPATDHWTPGAVATRARLYHAISMLLPDASILTAGGGAPGPQTNNNGEIYYPPYLFKRDGSGDFAPRPVIESAPSTALGWNQSFTIGVSQGTAVSRVTLVRTSAVTHAYNSEQRLMDLSFSQNNQAVILTTPVHAEDAPPGYYLLFVFDASGVPSVARILRIMDVGDGLPPPPPPPAAPAPPAEGYTNVYDGTWPGFTVGLGSPATECDRCQIGVDAPVVDGADGITTLRLKFKAMNYATGAWFRAPAALPAWSFRNLLLSVYVADPGLPLRIELGSRDEAFAQTGPTRAIVTQGLAAGWNRLAIPMTSYADAPFNWIAIKSADNTGSGAFWVDNIALEEEPRSTGGGTLVYDGTSPGFSLVIGNKDNCDQCAAGVTAPVVGVTDGFAAIRLKFKAVNYATGAFFRAPGYLATRAFSNLKLAVLPTDDTVRFRVEVGDRYPAYQVTGAVSSVVVSGLTPNQWNTVVIPMTRYADAPFNYVAIKSGDGLGSSVFYVDSVVLQP